MATAYDFSLKDLSKETSSPPRHSDLVSVIVVAETFRQALDWVEKEYPEHRIESAYVHTDRVVII